VPLCARRWPAGTVVLAGCYERDALVKLDDRPASSAGSTTILETRVPSICSTGQHRASAVDASSAKIALI